MFPVLLRLGPYTLFGHELGPWSLHTYGVLVALGFLAGMFVVLRGAKREGIAPEPVLDLSFATVLAAIVGSRLLYVAFNLEEYRDAPLRVFRIWEGGLVFYGGLLLAVPVLAVMIRRAGLPIWRTADVFAPAIALGQAIGRIGCFSAGCCYGCPADPPWGVVFTNPEALAPLHTPLFPVQLLASVSGFAIFGALAFYRPRRAAPGQVFWLYLVLASLSRVVEDALRSPGSRPGFLPWLSATQAISIGLGLTGLALFIFFQKRRKQSP